MVPVVPKPPISRPQKVLAIAIAAFADFLQVILFPFFGLGYVLDDAIDCITAFLLMIVCGFRWQFVLAFAIELVPGLDLFPTWTAVALMIPSISQPALPEVYYDPDDYADDEAPSSTETAESEDADAPVVSSQPQPAITATTVPPRVVPPIQ
jgi:hypothetical protein